MKRVQALWLLAAINVLLLAALCFKYNLAETPAHAQRAIGRGGDYVLLPAKNNVNPNGVVYMLDTRNARLSGFIYDGRGAQPMPPIDLARVFQTGPVRNP